MENQPFQSKTVFYAPVWTNQYNSFISSIKNDCRYKMLPKDKNPQYLLPYINRIYKDNKLFVQFELLPEYFPRLSLLQDAVSKDQFAELKDVRLSCFSTGCVFAEFHIVYSGMTVEQIADFSFTFKNAGKKDSNHPKEQNMEEALRQLIPFKNAEMFFTGADFKRECKMFHQIFEKDPLDPDELQSALIHLRRGYHRNFAIPQSAGEYDMVYQPYSYDHWAGSQEGLVNIFHYSGDNSTDKYLEKYKPLQLAENYSFMYLILLNQRFSAIKYLDSISQSAEYTRKKKETLNFMVSRLKTVFSFSVVSDDQLYQNLYIKMYSLLDIDRLLQDIYDNEEQVEMLQNHELLENEKMTSRFLFGLSVLSLFSVLVDAAGYFDRISILERISTPLSLICLLSILVCYLLWWIRYNFK